MGQYPELYLLVEPEKLLAGLPLLADIGMPGSDDWREELESGNSFMLGSGRSWLSVPEFCELLPSRLDWLRSVDPPGLRLDIRGEETDGERTLAFQLEQGNQFLHVVTTNWMQLALPEDARSKCMMLSISFERGSGKSKLWIPASHPVMPMLLRFLNAVCPIYGKVASDDADALNQYSVEETDRGVQDWQGLWHTASGCGFLGTELVQAVEERSKVLNADEGIGHMVKLPGVGLWYTNPTDWMSDSSPGQSQHWESIYLLAEILATIPDSAIFPPASP